ERPRLLLTRRPASGARRAVHLCVGCPPAVAEPPPRAMKQEVDRDLAQGRSTGSSSATDSRTPRRSLSESTSCRESRVPLRRDSCQRESGRRFAQVVHLARGLRDPPPLCATRRSSSTRCPCPTAAPPCDPCAR